MLRPVIIEGIPTALPKSADHPSTEQFGGGRHREEY